MQQLAIDTANAHALGMIPESCGAVTVGCTDVAGVVEAVIASSKTLRSEHEALAETVRALEADQTKVAEASDEARLLSERAIDRLAEGTALIQSSLAQISGHVDKVQRVLTSFDAAARSNEDRLHGAHRKMEELEFTASEMFDRIVQAGLSPEDSAMVEQAQAMTRELVAHTEAALAAGGITTSALFDKDYIPVPGTNPQLFRTRLTDWANAEWRPFLDRAKAGDSRVLAAACTDMNGFLPTHLTERSRTPTGDVNHDTQFCRNGRIMLGAIDRKAKASSAPYMMAVYRQEGDGESYFVVRNVYVPLVIGGRRWGDFELAYSFD